MSIVLYEKYISKEDEIKYRNAGYRVAKILDQPVIHKGESVGVLLDTLYKASIELIGDLLYSKHSVTIKYRNCTYNLHNIDEWHRTYQSEKDQLRLVSEYHPIYKEYLDKRAEYFQKQKEQSIKVRYECFVEGIKELPSDEELERFLNAFAYLYQIDVDYTDKLNMLQAYFTIQYYLENDIPYANEPHCIDYHEEPMFNGIQFDDSQAEEFDVEYYGDQDYLEDVIYKETRLAI